MNLSIFIARRYLFSKKKQNAINIISIISMVGVAIGTTALIVVLSVFNGIDTLLTEATDSFTPDLTISTAKGKKLRAAFEDGKLDASQIKSILSGGGLSTSKQPGRRVSVTLPPAFAPYFPPKATTKQIEETIQKALALYFKTMGNAS